MNLSTYQTERGGRQAPLLPDGEVPTRFAAGPRDCEGSRTALTTRAPRPSDVVDRGALVLFEIGWPQ